MRSGRRRLAGAAVALGLLAITAPSSVAQHASTSRIGRTGARHRRADRCGARHRGAAV